MRDSVLYLPSTQSPANMEQKHADRHQSHSHLGLFRVSTWCKHAFFGDCGGNQNRDKHAKILHLVEESSFFFPPWFKALFLHINKRSNFMVFTIWRRFIFIAFSASCYISASLSLPQRRCHVTPVVTRGVRPRALPCHQVRGESSSNLCLSLRCWGAAEWGQCKPGLTLPHFQVDHRVRGKSCLSLSSLVFHLLCPGRASEIFQSFKELFAAEGTARAAPRLREQVKQEMLGVGAPTLEKFFWDSFLRRLFSQSRGRPGVFFGVTGQKFHNNLSAYCNSSGLRGKLSSRLQKNLEASANHGSFNQSRMFRLAVMWTQIRVKVTSRWWKLDVWLIMFDTQDIMEINSDSNDFLGRGWSVYMCLCVYAWELSYI